MRSRSILRAGGGRPVGAPESSLHGGMVCGYPAFDRGSTPIPDRRFAAILRADDLGRGIGLRTHSTPIVFRSGALVVVPGRAIRTERVVSIPVPDGRRIPGMPDDGRGFVQTDQHGRVDGRENVFAAGDLTGLSAQTGRARHAAGRRRCGIDRLACRCTDHASTLPTRAAGPAADRVVSPLFLSAGLLDASSDVSSEPLWWPPAKIVGRYLAPFLALPSGSPPSLLPTRFARGSRSTWSSSGSTASGPPFRSKPHVRAAPTRMASPQLQVIVGPWNKASVYWNSRMGAGRRVQAARVPSGSTITAWSHLFGRTSAAIPTSSSS